MLRTNCPDSGPRGLVGERRDTLRTKAGDRDLNDLKILIGLTVRWIEMEQMTDAAVKAMPEGKK
jgi:hypothetical protein